MPRLPPTEHQHGRRSRSGHRRQWPVGRAPDGVSGLFSAGDPAGDIRRESRFGGGCNRGAAESSGEFLLFLNDDIEVLPGWLEALVETADRHPDAGAVGSLILFPDSTMQEAGAIVWRDGSTLCINRGGQVEVNPYNFLRPVDYCSACSLLVRRQPWAALGGFDARYFPAYYEGVDLCFGLARAGFRILFQPRSRAVHRETASSSTLRRDFAPQSLRKLRQRLIDHAYLGVRPLELRGTDVFIEKNKTSRFQAVAHLRVQVLQGGNVVNSRQPENDVVRWRSNTTWFRSAAR